MCLWMSESRVIIVKSLLLVGVSFEHPGTVTVIKRILRRFNLSKASLDPN